MMSGKSIFTCKQASCNSLISTQFHYTPGVRTWLMQSLRLTQCIRSRPCWGVCATRYACSQHYRLTSKSAYRAPFSAVLSFGVILPTCTEFFDEKVIDSSMNPTFVQLDEDLTEVREAPLLASMIINYSPGLCPHQTK